MTKYSIDTHAKTLSVDGGSDLPLYSKQAFELLSDVWLKVSWNEKYSYTFTWMGRPIIQHPEDMVRLQEIICDVKPDVIVETGVAHGGSLIFSASLMKAMGWGKRVVGVDIDIRPHNRKAVEEHALSPMIDLIEGDSASAEIVDQVKSLIQPGDKVMVILDSDHSYAHVMRELDAYSPLVTSGSYIVSTDGIMRDVADTPRGTPEWATDNPANAAEDFAKANADFTVVSPAWKFNESELDQVITGWPSAYLKKA